MKPAVAALVAFSPLLALAAPASAEPLTLDAAIDAALAHDPQVRASTAGVDAAVADRDSGEARFLPILRVEGNLQVWDSPTEVSFLGGGDVPQLPPPATPYEAVVAGLIEGFGAPTRIRDQVTADLTIAIIQPLTPLLMLSDTHALLDLGVDAARLQIDAARRQAALNVTTSFIGVHLAGALERSAQSTVDELDSQLQLLDTLVAGGVARETDRLRLQVARAAAAQDVIMARSRVRMARAALASAMGRRDHADLTLAPIPAIACRADATPVGDLQARALATRPELASVDAGARQAALAAELERNKLLPTVSAMAAYSHVEGQSLADKDTAFIGLALQWNVWEWGATRAAVTAADARARQVREQLGAVEDGVRLQVEQTATDLAAIAEGLSVAALAEEQATDGLRIETARYQAGDATATDVVTAEAALRAARDRRLAAHHQCLLAHANLRAAVGDPLSAATVFFAPAPEGL